RRGAGRPEEPVRRPVPADPRPVARAAGRGAVLRPPRPRPAAPPAHRPRARGGLRPRLALRAAPDDRGRAGGAPRARRARRGARGAVLRRRAPAAAEAGRRGAAGRDDRADHGARRAADDGVRPEGRDAPRRRPGVPRRPAVRLQGRRVRDVPRRRPRRRGRHAPQLRPGGGRAGRGIRPHVPDVPGRRQGHDRLRRLTGVTAPASTTVPDLDYGAGGAWRASASKAIVVRVRATVAVPYAPSARYHSTSEFTMPNSSRLTSAGGTSSRSAPSFTASATSAARRSSSQRRRSRAACSTGLLPRTRRRSVTDGWCATRTSTLRRTTWRRRS